MPFTTRQSINQSIDDIHKIELEEIDLYRKNNNNNLRQ